MSEVIALFRLALVRSVWFAAALFITVLIGCTVAMTSMPWNPSYEIAGFAIALTWLPAVCATIVLFDYGSDADLSLPASGCHRWLLRMPLQSWQIAVVPIVLKTLWILILWVIFVTMMRQLGTMQRVPLTTPAIALATVAVAVMAMIWRPFRQSWHRTAVLVFALPLMYGLVATPLAAAHVESPQWRPVAITGATLLVLAVYLASILYTFKTVRLARVASEGIIPEFESTSKFDLIVRYFQADRSQATERHFRGPWHALWMHDWIKSSDWIRKLWLLGILPAIVFSIVVLPVHVVAIIFVFAIFADFAFVGSQLGAPNEGARELPPYLAASPLSDATMAWGRSLVPIAHSLAVMSSVVLIFLGWALWPENRDAWLDWAAQCAAAVGTPEATVWVGVSTSAAIVLGVIAAVTGQVIGSFWVGVAGRTWFAIVAIAAMSLIVLILFAVPLGWFMRQTDWETTRASALSYLAWWPWVVTGLLVAKTIMVGVTIGWLRAWQLARWQAISTVAGIWFALVVVVGTVMTILIPDPRVHWFGVIAVTALVFPLARVLLLPVMIFWNRHR